MCGEKIGLRTYVENFIRERFETKVNTLRKQLQYEMFQTKGFLHLNV